MGILASTGESRKHGTKSRYFPRSQNLKTAQRAFLGIAHPYLELILYITGLPKGRGLRPMIFGSRL
ncbi:MAG: hypothetical protein BRC56_01615 [Cyanobacteria bacterium SW_9_47_5]|nr:MAG: hypothetical protein BRC56_01615 [Cyanobacteria bacterium SW_9_47_5]